jgi:hypothetical protein
VNKLNKWVGDNPVFAMSLIALVAVSVASRTPIFGLIDRTVGAVLSPVTKLIGGVTGAASTTTGTVLTA